MHSSEIDQPPLRNQTVDMSSEAITRRLREASELNQLGLSLARAKPLTSEVIDEDTQQSRPDSESTKD